MNEIYLTASVNDETGVNVQPDNVKCRPPLRHGADEIADRYSPKSLYVRICGQTQDDVFRGLLRHSNPLHTPTGVAKHSRYEITARNFALLRYLCGPVEIPRSAIP